MKKIIFTVLAIIAIAATSCTKQPIADFTTDKTNYNGGETITITNTSTDAYRYVWTLSDGTSSVAQNLTYQTSITQSGSLTIQLDAYSENNKKMGTQIKSVNITPTAGTATFWITSGYTTTVTISGISKQITYSYTSTPECGSDGCANFTLYPGTYYYIASNGVNQWAGAITATAGGCHTMRLDITKATGTNYEYDPEPAKQIN